MNTAERAPTEREEIEMLLPWYVTGKLDATDRERVDAYLATHPEMAHQLNLTREEMQEATAANETIALPPARAIDDLMAKVAAETPAAGQGFFSGLLSGPLETISGFFSAPSPNAVRWAAAAAAVVVLAQALTIGALVGNRPAPGTYQTASGGTAKPKANGTLALVRFAPGASAAGAAAALRELNMTIADGPKPGGFFVVRISEKSLDESARTALIAEMRKNKSVFMLVTPTK